ncbi:MAG: flagellin [Planctomycetota bacterium]
MTRINTNVSALSAQQSLAISQNSLQQALTRLSTGLRINSGKDDPAGLIASEILRSDITAVGRAISNSERANQMIATADSALGQVSALLNDVRGLVTEAANEGALSDEQIAANQLQIDSSLEAINRIAQMTAFQGRKLLDGSLDFQTTAGTNFSDITDLEITQANLGASGSMSVDVRVIDAAETAQVKMTGSTYTLAEDTLSFGSSLTFGAGGEIASGGILNLYSLDGTAYNIIITMADNAATAGDDSTYTLSAPGEISILVDTKAGEGGPTTVAELVARINASGVNGLVFAEEGNAGAIAAGDDLASTAMDEQTLKIAASTGFEGPDYNNMAITFVEGSGQAAGAVTAVWTDGDDRSTLVVTLGENVVETLSDIKTAIETATGLEAGSPLTVTVGSVSRAATSIYTARDEDTTDIDGSAAGKGNTMGTGGGVLTGDLVVQITGETGSEFLTFDTGTQMDHIASAINAISDTLGMTASVADGSGSDAEGTLVFSSSGYGSSALVDIDVVSDGGAFEANLTVDGSAGTRDTGTDINATVNGSATQGDGNTLTLSTAMLDIEATIAAGVEKTISFTIDSGGALFQLGPDVVSTQQARLGIQSVNAAQLRGESGRLYELGSGQAAALTADTTTAGKIVDEVISKVTSLRGRLGAFQKTTLDPTIASLNDTLVTLTDAESSIRDADFAAETAALTRAQILVQAGMSVLSVANSNPQNVLALLR